MRLNFIIMKKAIFFDRDGTINIDKGYVHKIKDFEFIPKAINALQLLSKTDYKLIVVTTQSGIGRGFYSENDAAKVNDYMRSELRKHDVEIAKTYICPHSPDAGCSCRKPKTGLLESAAKDFNLKLKDCYVIDDKTAGIKMGKNAGCKTILVLTGKAGNERGKFKVKPDFIAKDLYGAARYILNKK